MVQSTAGILHRSAFRNAAPGVNSVSPPVDAAVDRLTTGMRQDPLPGRSRRGPRMWGTARRQATHHDRSRTPRPGAAVNPQEDGAAASASGSSCSRQVQNHNVIASGIQTRRPVMRYFFMGSRIGRRRRSRPWRARTRSNSKAEAGASGTQSKAGGADQLPPRFRHRHARRGSAASRSSALGLVLWRTGRLEAR